MNPSKFQDVSFPSLPVFTENLAEIRVDPKIENPISSAIQQAPYNATIIIPEGKYKDNIVIKKRIQLIGDGNVVISPKSNKDAIIIDSSAVLIKSIEITGGEYQGSTAVNIISGSVVFDRCLLSSIYIPALLTHLSGTVHFINSGISTKEGPCIKLSGSVKCDINHSTLSGSSKCGIFCCGSSFLRINDSTITKCCEGGIISLENSKFWLSKVQIVDNGGNGIEINSSGDGGIWNSTITKHLSGCSISCNGTGKLSIFDSIMTESIAGIAANGGYAICTSRCQIGNALQSALVSATNGGRIIMNEDKIGGNCAVGILITAKSSVSATKINLSGLPSTGVAIYTGSSFSLEDSIINKVEECGIEAHSDSDVSIKNSSIESVGTIGLLCRGNCRCKAYNVNILKCGVACIHGIDCLSESEYSKCLFSQSSGNAVNIKNSAIKFLETSFTNNSFSGIEIRGPDGATNFANCIFSQNKLLGANILEGATSSFDTCTFSNNSGSGASIFGSKCNFQQSQFVDNVQMGLCAYGGSVSTFHHCLFQKNNSFGAQIEQQSTDLSFNECEFSSHSKSGAVILNENCVGRFTKCLFYENKNSHIEARQGTRFSINGTEMSRSGCGIGVMLHSGSAGMIENSKFHDESQAGVVIGNGGDARITTSEFYGCGITAVYMLQGSNGSVSKCKIHHNGVCGIQILSGSPIISDNVIENNNGFGIHVAAGATPQIGTNQYNNNAKNNVNKA